MPAMPLLDLRLPDAAATDRFADALAARLGAGDAILLSGPLGAGKSHLARRIIQVRQSEHGAPEDVPSPTFTLVQTYMAGDLEIWHADLYRLADASEVVELGLADAFETALVLVEWPDRLGPLAPRSALHLHLALPGSGRHLTASATDQSWPARLSDLR